MYVVGEGGRNIARRIAAWMQEHDVPDVKNMFAVLEAVQVPVPDDLNRLEAAINELELKPALIVFDTLARCYGGGDENSAQDMGRFVSACDRLRNATGAAVLAVHHTGKGLNSGTERGSSALRGAADSMISVEKNKGAICVKVDKQKDDEPLPPMFFRLRSIEVTRMSAHSRSTSAVLEPSNESSTLRGLLHSGAFATLKVLVVQHDGIAESSAWRESVKAPDGKNIAPRTFQNHRDFLVRNGYIEVVDGQPHWYRVTPLGSASATGVPAPPDDSPNSAASATPPLAGC